ncbi:MAG: CHAD domain-containing protein [Phycisphaerae bacterium]|nr:CHAD domain-containing protein [Saprospiraceae bacterium]
MLKKKRQKKKFKTIGKSMVTHLSDFFGTKNAESLHHFRIQVKKIKALLFFLQDEKSKTEGLSSLRSIFKHAGQIRAAQINLGLLKAYHVNDVSYKVELEHIERDEIERFFAKRNAYTRIVKLAGKVLSKKFQNVGDKHLVRLYRKQLKKLSRFFNQPGEPIEKWHETRKKIKNLLYLYRILPKSLVHKLHLNDAYLDQLQEAIGKWHDIVLILELLKSEGYAKKGGMATIHLKKRSLYHSIQMLSHDFEHKVEPITT